MKIKTFILTFLLMSCPFLFGQSHWIDPNLGGQESMTICATIDLDGNIQTEDYEVAVFHNQTLLEVGEIILAPNNTLYHVDLNVVGDNSMKNIYFKFFDRTNENEYVSLTKVDFNADGIGLHTAPLAIKFKSVAKIGDVVYSTLQDAVNACTTGDNTITLLDNVSDDVTIKQVENVNVLINGNDKQYSGTFTIHGNARYEGAETLTFTNINFVTSEASHYFIDSNSTESDKRYAHNVTVDKCTFTATATSAAVNSAAAMRIRQGFDIAINESTFNGLHSALQAYGNKGITVTDITLDGKNGISAGTSSDVTISRSTINATGYGVRADANADVTTEIEIKNTNIEAFIPVVVRNASKKSNITFENNTFVGNNSDGLLCAIGITEYEENGSLPTTTTGKVIVNTTNYNGVYGNTVAQVQYSDNSVKYFTNINTAVPNSGQTGLEGATITLLSNCEGKGLRFWKNNMTFDLGGKTFTINAATGSSGSETSGFQIRPEVTEATTIQNGTIAVKTGTPVVWMFNNYAKQFNLKNVTVDCANMDWSWGNQVYALVSHKNNNGNTKFENVELINFNTNNGNPYYLENSTSLTAPEGLTSTIDTDNGAVVTYENGTYSAASAVAQVGDKTFSSVAYAIKAATAGQTITLLKDVEESFTISKSVTIDGAGKKYTGTMTGNKGLNITIQNVNFVNAGFDKPKAQKTSTGNYTFTNCTFDGESGAYAYPIRVYGANLIKVEDCTVKDYQYSFLYVVSGTNTVYVKDVTVMNCPNYAVYFASGVNNSTIENLTVTNSNNGILYDNQTADRKLNSIKGCTFVNVTTAINHSKGDKTITCNLNGVNDFGGAALSQYVKIVAEAQIGNKFYGDLNDALAAAQTGETVYIFAGEEAYDQELTINKAITVEGKNGQAQFTKLNITADGATAKNIYTYNPAGDADGAYINAKDVTIDGCSIQGGWGGLYQSYTSGAVTFKNSYIGGGVYGIHFDGNNGGNIVIDNCEVAGWTSFAKTITNVAITNTEFIEAGYNQLRFYQNAQLENCTFNANMTIDFGTNDVDADFTNCTVEDGASLTDVIYLGDIVEMGVDVTINGEPLIVEAKVADADGQNAKYYLTLAEAVNAATTDQVVTVCADVELANTLTIAAGKVVTLDLNGKVVSGVSATAGTTAVISNKGNLTVKSSVEGGKITTQALYPDTNWGGEGQLSFPSYANNTVRNEGTFTLVSGTIENTSAAGGATYAIDNYNGSTTNIEGGLVYCQNNIAIRLFCGDNIALNVNGGEVKGTRALWIQLASSNASVAPNVDVNVTDGTLTATGNGEYKLAIYSYSYGNNMQNVEINISGGTFNGDIALTGGSNKENVEKLNITGGTFNGKDGDVYSYGDDAKAIEAITIKGGTFTTNAAEKYAEDDNYIFVENAEGKYNVTEGAYVAAINGERYSSVAKAITAAQAGDIITLLKDVNENVTISKSLTFDGGNFNSTGLFTITNGNVTFKNFKIEGNSNYFVKVNGGGDNHVFEDCTITNSQGLVNVAKSTNSIVVKNVTIEKCTYGARLVSFNDATFENVTIDVVTRRGVDIQNQGDRNVTFINCTNYAEKPVQVQSNNSTGTVTFNFKGTNDFSENESTYSDYAKLILVDNESSLKDKEGLNVTTTFNGYSVKYLDGAYKLVPNVARIGEVTYASIQEAINAAENGNEIVVLQDVTLAYEDAKQLCNGTFKSFFNVDGKNITIDLNGKTIKAEMGAELEANAVYGLVTTENNANLTIKDSSTEKTGTMWIDNVVEVYSLIMQYDGSTITIEGGNYKLNVGGNGRGMVYANDDEKVTVIGGNFHLGNVGKLQNGSPWIFNTSGQNSKNVTVYGGTYNANVFNQHYIFEVQSSIEYAIEVNSNGTWTIVPSVAWVDNQEKSGNWYTYDIGYATLEEAFAAAAKCNREDYVETVTMLQDITLKNPITVNAGEEIVLELNGKSIDVANENINCDIYGKLTLEDNVGGGVFTSRNHWVHENAEFIVNNGTVQNIATATGGFPINLDGGKVTINGGIVQALNGVAGGNNYGNYAIGGGNGGTIVMNGGEVKGNWGAINLQAGSATINGGTLKVTAAIGGHALYVAGNATATINGGEFIPSTECGSYSVLLDSDDSEVIITAGRFHKGQGTVLAKSGKLSIKGGTFDQDVNAYCAENFAAIANNDGTWTVKPTQKQHLVKGWNWYSSYLDIETDDLTDAIGTNGLEIKGQTTADGSKIFDNSWGIWTGTLVYNNAKMYMINTTQACELDLSANIVNPQDYTITLNTGWNWIGYPSNQSVEINAALANIPTPQEGDIIKTRNSGHAEYAWGMWVGTLKSMIPGEGYMYRNTSGEAKTFKYNVTNTRGTAEANMTSENNYWTPNVAEYPYNMTMTAILDGENNGNYEIAAFVNGEVRGSARPIYVEQLDSYMFFLTVNGNNVEEMTFKCYDLTTGEEFDLINRMNYSNDAIVGSVNEPYLLSRGTVGLEEVSSFNIYPNPTTTDREINLSTTCDKVEVFNALGVKVAEYQNVDTIDAFETAGIYVIRVTNNGNVKHCRLVVK